MTGALAVTGSTGALGGLVAGLMAEAGFEQRLLVRDVARAPRLPRAKAVPTTYGDPLPRAALDGVETLFMVSAKESPDRLRQHHDFIEAAREAGVRHIVYTSFAGAAADATFTFARDHHATEQFLADSGMDVTVLRDNFYMDLMPHFAGVDNVIRGPAGPGRAALVARADVASAAASILTSPGSHTGRTYDLTGPEALSMAEIAAQLSATSGRVISYLEESVEDAYESRSHYGAAPREVDAWVSTYTAIAAGELSTVSDDVKLLTGRAPQSFADYLTAQTGNQHPGSGE